jgi:hypothetical protein
MAAFATAASSSTPVLCVPIGEGAQPTSPTNDDDTRKPSATPATPAIHPIIPIDGPNAKYDQWAEVPANITAKRIGEYNGDETHDVVIPMYHWVANCYFGVGRYVHSHAYATKGLALSTQVGNQEEADKCSKMLTMIAGVKTEQDEERAVGKVVGSTEALRAAEEKAKYERKAAATVAASEVEEATKAAEAAKAEAAKVAKAAEVAAAAAKPPAPPKKRKPTPEELAAAAASAALAAEVAARKAAVTAAVAAAEAAAVKAAAEEAEVKAMKVKSLGQGADLDKLMADFGLEDEVGKGGKKKGGGASGEKSGGGDGAAKKKKKKGKK